MEHAPEQSDDPRSAAPKEGLRAAASELVRIALPTVITMTSYTIMQMIDGLMVSRIGPEPVYVAAQGNGGIVVWVFLAIVIGVVGVVSTFVSQNLGAGKSERGASYGWAGIWIPVAAWPLMLLMALLCPLLFRALGDEGQLLELETRYAQVLFAGAIFSMLAKGVSQFFFGMHRPTVVMVAAILANAVNIGLNYVLIFGHFGVPALGIVGAAIGTVGGVAVESAILIAVFLSPKYAREFGTRKAIWCGFKPIKDVFKLGWPAGLMMGNDILCWSILMAVLLGLGGEAGARHAGVDDPDLIREAGELGNNAGWIALRYMHVAFMPAVGISIALTAAVGKCMGARRDDLAVQRAWVGIAMAGAYMSACAVAMVLFREPMIGAFIDGQTDPATREELLRIGGQVMIAAALFQLFDALGITTIAALRGAGDTVVPGILTVVLNWVVLIGGGFAAVWLLPQLGSVGPWVAAALFIAALGVTMFWRFLAGGWRSLRLVEESDAPEQPFGAPAGSEAAAMMGEEPVLAAPSEPGTRVEPKDAPDGVPSGPDTP